MNQKLRKILVVDDEQDILELFSDLLEPPEFDILLANGPHEAISLFDQHHEHISLMISDIRMPKMNGLELYDQLKNRGPAEFSVIFMSGYSDIDTEQLNNKQTTFLKKPFDLSSLKKTILKIQS